jgi:hypothetical protein
MPFMRSVSKALALTLLSLVIGLAAFSIPRAFAGQSPSQADDSPYSWYGFNFEPGSERIMVRIYPVDKQVNKGKPIVVRFWPGEKCRFGDKNGCVVAYQPDDLNAVVFVSLHSGITGQGQRLRNVLEGTGLNRAKYKMDQVTANLQALSGAEVTITQGEYEVGNFRLMVAARLPGSVIGEYFSVPAQEALAMAAGVDPGLEPYVVPEQPQFVIETCGWKMAGEERDSEATDTSASIYLVVIQLAP